MLLEVIKNRFTAHKGSKNLPNDVIKLTIIVQIEFKVKIYN